MSRCRTVKSFRTALLGSVLLSASTEALPKAHARTLRQPRPTSVRVEKPQSAAQGSPRAAAPKAARPRDTHTALKGGSENIAVTGNRGHFRFHEDQSIATSSTHLSSETLLRHGVLNLSNLETLAPNVTIQQENGTIMTDFWIRGIGMKDFTQNNTPSVMPYVDGVAFPLSPMMAGMFFDVDNVEINPGPVGTTHGLADSGGEVLIQTKDPTPDWHAGVMQDIASYARSRTDLYVSGPITQGLSFRLSAQTLHGGGWQTDPQTHSHLGDANEGALRAKLLWTPDSKTSIRLTGSWVQDDSETIVPRPVLNLLPSQNIPTLPYTQTSWSMREQFAKLIGRPASLKPSEHDTFWGSNLNIKRRFGPVQFESISAFQTEREGEYTDQDGTSFADCDLYRNVVANSFSQEVKFSNTPSASRLHWVAGMYYNRVRMQQSFFYDFTDYRPARGYIAETAYRQRQQTFTQYANLSYDLPHGVSLFGGINHESDDRQLLGLRSTRINTQGQLIYDTLFNNVGALGNQFSGNVGIQWQIAPRYMTYFKISKGFKPGGFTANNTVAQAQIEPFKPETLLAYELGFKSDPIPNKLRLNGAAFYYDYHGQQYLGSYVVPGYGNLGKYINIPKSEMWGVEFSLQAHPFKYLFITQNLGYQRGQYQIFNAVNGAATNALYAQTGIWQGVYSSFAGTDSGNPKLTLNGEADFRNTIFRKYQIELGLDWSYRDSQALVAGGLGPYRLPAYFLLGSHLTFQPQNQRWSVTVYATNLINRQYYTAGVLGSTTQVWEPGAPRFIGARLKYDY